MDTKIIKELIKKINISNISYPVIKSNSFNLYKLFKELKLHWSSKTHIQTKIYSKSEKYYPIYKIVLNSLLSDYPVVKDTLCKFSNYLVELTEKNISFYYFNFGNYEQDILHINYLMNQAICLAKFSNIKHKVMIIWIPIDISRDFNYSILNSITLKETTKTFTAFTASGVTFGQNPRITIISRYENVDKLMLHELIHNYYLDGCIHHEENKELIYEYKTVKNPPTLNSIKNYDYDYSIYESWTELYSGYLRMCFRNINLINKQEIISRFETEILFELLYSYNTICNIIKLNGYSNYKEFTQNKKFFGEICTYEYYYLKGLMYNNYKLIIPNKKNDFTLLYKTIMTMNKNDPLLEDVFNNMVSQTNFKYTFYD